MFSSKLEQAGEYLFSQTASGATAMENVSSHGSQDGPNAWVRARGHLAVGMAAWSKGGLNPGHAIIGPPAYEA